jgi:hypothetical protein
MSEEQVKKLAELGTHDLVYGPLERGEITPAEASDRTLCLTLISEVLHGFPGRTGRSVVCALANSMLIMEDGGQ